MKLIFILDYVACCIFSYGCNFAFYKYNFGRRELGWRDVLMSLSICWAGPLSVISEFIFEGFEYGMAFRFSYQTAGAFERFLDYLIKQLERE